MLSRSWLCISMATVFTLSGWAASPVSFNSPQVYEPAGSGVVAADFNGDGKLDLAVLASQSLAILEGNGKGQFRPKVSYSLPDGIGGVGISLAAGDLNGDGNLDLVALHNTSTNNVAVFMGNGDGTFQAPSFYTVGVFPETVVVADFNGDGKPDFAVSTYEVSNISIFLNNGNGTFTPVTPIAVNAQSGFTAADFNGDGKADLAVTTGIMLSNGDGTFQPALPYPGGDTIGFPIVADFNGDGIPDLAGNTQGDLGVFLGKGNGAFQPPNVLSGWSGGPFAIGDFNGDGKVDLASTGFNSAYVFLNNGQGGLTPPAMSAEATYGVEALAVGDFNGDGKLDIVTAGSGTTILLGNGQGMFQQPVSYPVIGSSDFLAAIVAADLNGDGRPDLLMSDLYSSAVSVVLNQGHGSYTQGAIYGLPYPPSSLAIGDFNGDGKVDVAVSMIVENQIAVLLGNGDGTFGAPVIYDGGRAPASIAVGDFNGDGKLDIVSAGTGISILLGNGDGTFQAPTHIAIGGEIYSVAVADLNGDGNLDIVAANTIAIAVLLGNGNGTFQPAQYLASGNGPYSVTVADLNGDGKPDLAVVNRTDTTSSVGILLGNGDGTFQPPVEYPISGNPAQVTVADFNGDGHPDLAVLCVESFIVAIMLGDGQGHFQSGDDAPRFLAPTYPYAMTVADMNGDGKPDIPINASDPNGLGILTNTTPY